MGVAEQAAVRRPSGRLLAILMTREGAIGAGFVSLVVLLILVGPAVAPYSPTEIGVGPPASRPSAAYPLGTDQLGRDVLSRFLNGGLGIVVVPVVAVSVAFLLGATVGLALGYVGGRVDAFVVRLVDVVLAIPPILIALVLIVRLGGSVWILTLIVALVFSPRIVRIVRGAVQNIRAMDYVLAAQAQGEPPRRVVFDQMLPNVAGPLLVEYGIRVNFGIAFVASLNFLGLAAQPPSSNWGLMISEYRDLIASNPLAAIVPAAAIAALVVGISLLTDAAAKVLSPELALTGRR